MATKDILRAYEGSMAGPSMDAFQNIFQSEARAKGGKYDTGRGFWNMAVQGAEKLDTKIGDWQAAKKSGDENVGDISGLKGFAKYALGSGKGDKYEEWAQIGRGKEGYDERSEKDFSDIALGGIGGAIGGVARIGGDIKKEIGARYEGGRRQREKNRSTVADDRYNAQFGYDEQPMVERQQGTGIMGHLKGGIGKVGEFFRNADFGPDKGMGLGDYEDPTMGYRQGGYIKKYEQGGKVPEKDEEGGEKSGWFPEGKFLGRDVPKGAGGLMDMLVMGVAGGGAMSKVASRASKAPRLRAASKPSSIKPLTKAKQKAMEKRMEKARKKDISMNWKDLDIDLDDLEYLRPYQVKGLNPRPKATMKDWSEEFQDISESMAVRGRPQTEKAKLTAIELRDKMNKAYRKMKETNPYWDKLPTEKKAGGGMINGPDHENGGVDIEVEGGEYIIPTNIVEKYGKGFFDLLKEGKL